MPEHDNKKNLTLITGGARSGKSELAESIALASGRNVHYLATMERWQGDEEGAARIARHKRRRPSQWATVEASRRLDQAVLAVPADSGVVIIDCLSVYVSNLLLENYQEGEDPYDRQEPVSRALEHLLAAIDKRSDQDFVIVTNEVGWGVVPNTPLGRAYRDFLGLANQEFARQAGTVWLMCSGLKLRLK